MNSDITRIENLYKGSFLESYRQNNILFIIIILVILLVKNIGSVILLAHKLFIYDNLEKIIIVIYLVQ